MKKYIVIFVNLFLFNSCIGLKDLNYLQPNENLELNQHGLVSKNIEKYKLQIDDILSVRIQTLDPDAIKFLIGQQANQIFINPATAHSAGSPFYFTGYKINNEGKINILGLGEFKVEGKTVDEAEKLVMKSIETTIYKENISEIKLSLEGINFTILGEVGAAGAKSIARVNINLLDALAASGDLNKLADRKNIILIRQYPEGSKRVNIDITREDIQNSPYFWIQPNDFIIVNSRKEKITGLGGNTYVSDIFQALSLAVSAATMYIFFTKL